MKLLSLVSTAAILASSTALATPASTAEQTPSFSEAASAYFKTTKAQNTFEQGVVLGLRNSLSNGQPSQSIDTLTSKLAEKYFSWQPVEQKFIKLMQQQLSADDLKKATDFYQSKAGQKMVQLEPSLNKTSVQYIQRSLKDHARDIESAINHVQFQTLLQQAKAKNASALTQATLGEVYLKGIGTEASPKKALPWLKKAAKRGNPMAQSELAKMYDLGVGVKPNPTRAVIWYHRAANQGDANAMYQIARHFASGSGVPKNPEKAAQWYQDSAMRSNICGKYNTGINYMDGKGFKKNPTLAKAWLSSFAEVAYFTLNPHAKLKKIYAISQAYANFEVDDHGKTAALAQSDISKEQAEAVSNLQQNAHKICA